MKLPVYTSTPGLDHYSKHERFAVYRAAHKRLMIEDSAYRKRWNAYFAGIVCMAFIPVGGFAAEGRLGDVFFIVSTVAVTVTIIYLAFRQQKFMNQRIGEVLAMHTDLQGLRKELRG